MSEHALLSASSAHRWLHCTPSARLEEQYPDTTSEYAEEGTLAHEIAALKLSKYFAPMGPRAYTTKLNKLKSILFTKRKCKNARMCIWIK